MLQDKGIDIHFSIFGGSFIPLLVVRNYILLFSTANERWFDSISSYGTRGNSFASATGDLSARRTFWFDYPLYEALNFPKFKKY